MIAEHLAQRLVQKVCCRVVAAYGASSLMIDFERKRRAHLEHPLLDHAGVHEEIAGLLLRIGDPEAQAVRGHRTGIADLPAGFAVKRRLVEDDGAALAGFERSGLLAVLDQRSDHALRFFGLVTEEFGRADLLAQRKPERLGRSLARSGPRGAGLLALALHRRIESL